MEIKVLDLQSKEKGKIKLPDQFDEDVRLDLIQRAFLAIRSHNRTAYGAHPEAGKRASAVISRRRHDYRGAYGIGISRVPRKIMSRRGTRMNWQGAFAPGTAGGRRAHPPTAEKIWWEKINKKERRKAIRSAISATLNRDLVAQRGHKISSNYPFVIEPGFEELDKTKKVKDVLISLGLKDELMRCEVKKVRPGKGKMRGRKYKKKKGLLIVVGKDSKLCRAAKNIPGVDVSTVKDVNVELLAPGGVPGRITLWSKNAIERLEKDKLFI
jgi:large subunit ribosomal protein L4e